MYTLYNTSVELNTRLATAPQPAFHYNTLLASLAINSSLLLRRILHSIFQQLPRYQPPLGYQPQLGYQLQLCNSPNSGYQLNSEGYDLWSDCREDSAFGVGCLAITRETGTLSSRACTLPSNVYSMVYMLQYVFGSEKNG
jgi:hypothetical protein